MSAYFSIARPARWLGIVGVTAMISFAASAAETCPGTICISDAWARATPGNAQNGALFLTISNHGEMADSVTGVSTDIARETMLHETMTMGGTSHMHMVAELPVPAGESVTLAPGVYHIMLMGLGAPLVEGEQVSVTIEFADAESITLDVPVLEIGAMGPEN